MAASAYMSPYTAGKPYAPGGALYDENGNPIPASSWLSPGDMKRTEASGWTDAAVAGGLGAAGQLGQVGLTLIDTPQDTYNKQRMKELDAHKGLTGGERADIDEQAMRGVRALSTENRDRAEAQLAGSGGHSAADLSRVRRDSEANTNNAAIHAADIGIQANREQVAKDVQESEERRSYESSRQRQRIEMLGQTLTGLATALTPALSSQLGKREATDGELLSMQRATLADGSPAYPGLQRLDLAGMRTYINAQTKTGKGPDGAATAGSDVAAKYV